MSKKMLKRSLALSALMAFVITGQAWAADNVTAPIEIYEGGTATITDYTGTTNLKGVELKTVNGNYEITKENVEYSLQGLGTGTKQVITFQANAEGINVVFVNNASFIAETSYTGTGGDQVTALGLQGDNTITFKGNATFNAKSTNIEGKSVYGVSAGGYGKIAKVNFNGSSVNVYAEGNTDRKTGVSAGEESRGNITGISVNQGILTASKNTTVNVTVKSTGETIGQDWVGKYPFRGDKDSEIKIEKKATGAAYANGISVLAGKVDLQGNTELNVEAKGAKAYGVYVEDGYVTSVTGTINDSSEITLNNAIVKVKSEKNAAYGMYATERDGLFETNPPDVDDNSKITTTGSLAILVEAGGNAYGVYNEKGAETHLADTNIEAITKSGNAFGIYSLGTNGYVSNVTVDGDLTIDATGKTNSMGVYVREYSDVVLGGENKTNDITITAKNTEGVKNTNVSGIAVYGYNTLNTAAATVNANNLNVEVHATGQSGAYGINANSGSDTGTTNSSLRINANKTVINATSEVKGYASALVAMSGSSIAVEGDLEAKADRAIFTRGGATTEINKSGNSTVVLNGDIVFGRESATSGEKIDANVLVNLTGEKSKLAGSIYANYGESSEITGMKLNLSGGAQWELSKASLVNKATFGKDTVLILKEGSVFETKEAAEDNVYALNAGGGEANKLTVEQGAKLQIGGIKETTYNIATGFADYKAVEGWTEIADNNLMKATLVENDGSLQAQIVTKEATEIAESLGVSETTGDFLSNLAEDAGASNVKADNVTAKGKLVGLANAAANSHNDVVIAKAAAQAVEAVQKMAEAGGNSATAAKVVTNVTGVTNQRLSLNNGNHGGNKGGHGVGLLEEGSGAAIWAQYVHGKDSVEDMPSDAGASSYEGQYNGIVMGVDFKKVGKFQSGIAFNYGEGDTNSVNTSSPTRSDYDFWGIGYYGNIRNADSNVIFDIGYAKTDSDVTSSVNVGALKQTYEASPETTTWTAGVKVEKLYQNNNVQIVPYTGLRYMSIDPDDYSTKCGALSYNLERQDIWLLPVGVSIKQEIVNPNGWVVTPKVDLSYIWAFGDTDSSMETNTVFGTDNRPIGYDVMDDGSWMGLVGVEAAMDDWTFGVSYSYQKGDHSESKKWYVDAKYSF